MHRPSEAKGVCQLKPQSSLACCRKEAPPVPAPFVPVVIVRGVTAFHHLTSRTCWLSEGEDLCKSDSVDVLLGIILLRS